MHTSVGDIHRYLSADEPFGSSHQVPANPAPSWPKGGVRDEGQGWWPGKNLPLPIRVVKLAQHLGNVSTLLLVLSEHPLKDGACTLSLGRLAIPYPGYKHHYYAQGHHQSAHTYRHCSVRLFYFQGNKGCLCENQGTGWGCGFVLWLSKRSLWQEGQSAPLAPSQSVPCCERGEHRGAEEGGLLGY